MIKNTTEETLIYHLCTASEWEMGKRGGWYRGSTDDINDGFIHFSTSKQLLSSFKKHHQDKDDLILVTADSGSLGSSLIWEISRGGDLFPHLYGKLELIKVTNVQPLPLDMHGKHFIPDEVFLDTPNLKA